MSKDITDELIIREDTSGYSFDEENSIEEDIKILEGIIKGDEDCINAIYSQMKVKNANDEDIQYYKKEIQSIKNIVDNYLKEKARTDKLEKEYSAMLTKLDENECDYKRVLKENEELLEVKVSASACNRILELEKENEELKIKNNAIKRESEAYAEHMIRLDNELNLEKEKSKYEWIRQNCLSQELVNKLYIPVQKVKDKIKELEEELEIMKVDNMYGRYKEYGGKTKWERLFATKYGMHDVLQELLEGRKQNV